MENRNLLKKKYVDVAAVFLASRLCFILLIIIFTDKSIPDFLKLFDGESYIGIAENGYSKPYLTAFFPMIPLLIRFFGVYGLVAINQICLFISMVLLKKFVEEDNNSPSAIYILLVFAFSPVSYFSLLVYTESVFFFLTLSAFYLFSKRKYPWLMGILIGLSVFTRNTGSIVFFAIFAGMVIRWVRKENKLSEIFKVYVPATIISLIHPVYLQVKFGNWKVFVDVQYHSWYRIPSNVFKTYYNSFRMLFTNDYDYDIYTLTIFRINEIITILITVFLLYLCSKEIKRLRKLDVSSVVSVVVVILSVIMISTSIVDPGINAPTRSFYRYYLGMFPSFTLLHDLNPKIIYALVIISALSGVLMSSVLFREKFFC